jgi:hypothetical protein
LWTLDQKQILAAMWNSGAILLFGTHIFFSFFNIKIYKIHALHSNAKTCGAIHMMAIQSMKSADLEARQTSWQALVVYGRPLVERGSKSKTLKKLLVLPTRSHGMLTVKNPVLIRHAPR